MDAAQRRWARSGAMWLTGSADGPPLPVGAPIASHMHSAARRLEALGGAGVDGPALLGERAAIAGFTRRGARSVGGACTIERAADGWVALNLPRPTDVEAVPALVGTRVDPTDWVAVRGLLRGRDTASLIAAGAALGMAVAGLDEVGGPRARPCDITAGGPMAAGDPGLVVDMTSLWAGPLCTGLLAGAGHRVVKVEHPRRPDGARRGPPPFFDLLNAGKESVALDLDEVRDRALLDALIDNAAVVVEGMRPRVLDALGVDRWRFVEHGGIWVTLSAHGAGGPWRDRAGFGDDAAFAGGLVAWEDGAPRFVADAVADPVAGLHGAVAVLGRLASGTGGFIDLSLSGVAAHCRTIPDAAGDALDGDRRAEAGGDEAVRRPRARPPRGIARPLGADTDRLRAELL